MQHTSISICMQLPVSGYGETRETPGRGTVAVTMPNWSNLSFLSWVWLGSAEQGHHVSLVQRKELYQTSWFVVCTLKNKKISLAWRLSGWMYVGRYQVVVLRFKIYSYSFFYIYFWLLAIFDAHLPRKVVKNIFFNIIKIHNLTILKLAKLECPF